MKVLIIAVGDDSVSLRLTASKLAAYAAETGSSGNTLFAIMDALDNVDNRAKLLTAALTFKGNSNRIQDGYELLDMLADAEYGPVKIKELIVSLAVDSGVVGRDDAAKLTVAIKTGSEKLYKAAVAVLSGDIPDVPSGEKGPEDSEENPI